MSILIFGHKNPDTDSVASAIALSRLKNTLGMETRACILDEVSRETEYVLKFWGAQMPEKIKNVKIQIEDLEIERTQGVLPHSSIRQAYKTMEAKSIKILPVLDGGRRLLGILTMKDIAMSLVKGEHYTLDTSISNLLEDLHAELITGDNQASVRGEVLIGAFYHETLKKVGLLNENSIVIVGDRYDIIDLAIEKKVRLIIITGGNKAPKEYVDAAAAAGIAMISSPEDTFATAKIISQCNFVSSIMKSDDIIKFRESEYMEELADELRTNRHSNYPVVWAGNIYKGFVNRRHILSPGRKKVILVDHNEYAQSAKGLEEAEILEIVDHHKIGDISTTMPISFRNIPVGSTCTIVYNMYGEAGVELDNQTGGLLISGILSDTLLLQSPTTTESDRKAVAKLSEMLGIDAHSYAMDMFKEGTSLAGQTTHEIFYNDFKEFTLDGFKVGISQVFTLDTDEVFKRKEEFIDFVNKVQSESGYDITLLVITDILRNGSYLIFKEEHPIMKSVLGDFEQGGFREGVVSRKKQVIPTVMKAISMIK